MSDGAWVLISEVPRNQYGPIPPYFLKCVGTDDVIYPDIYKDRRRLAISVDSQFEQLLPLS